MQQYRLYKQRWYILLVVSLLNFSNAMTWVTFASITYYTDIYYGNENAATIFNVIFMVLSIPLGIVAMWGVDRFGIRPVCIFGSMVNFVGNLFRVLGSASFITDKLLRFWLVVVGQIGAASAQPFIMYLPTKMAALWFAENQRVIANTIASMSNPLGVAAIYAISPVFVNADHSDWFIELTGTVCGLTLITMLLSFGVTSSKPKLPPSASSEDRQTPKFVESLRQIICIPAFWVLVIAVGSSIGLFNCIYNNLQPTLCSRGYSNTYSGIMGAGMIVSGISGAAVAGIIVDSTKRFLLVYKICLVGTLLAAVSLALTISHENRQYLIATFIFAFGFFGFPTYPLGLELAVETTFPVPEATSSGSLIVAGQVFGVLYIVITGLFNRSPSERLKEIQTCVKIDKSIEVNDWEVSSYIWTAILVLTCVIGVSLFWPRYRRIEYENAKRQMNVVPE
ncbi:hypothetical protein M3Y96_00880300 [Aphelenchoides besseyi]|nr:hypothetical protein M3Y96_00880300 [Aphelenchoides besseyi]